jgi:PPM family protein phosphatase
MEQSMTFDYGRVSDRGQKRPENEDALFVPANLNEVQEQGALFLIADGMGSYGNGKLAANSTISRLTDYYYSGHQPIEQALETANRDVYAMSQSNPQYDGMGTTIVGVLANFDGRFQVFNVGDSRAYFLRNGKIELISKDHSVVAKRAEDEGITWEEAAKRGKTNQLTRSIGRRPEVKTEFLDPQTKQILGGSDRLKVGDALVLCSDGMWRDIKSDEIQRVVRKARSAQAASEELVKMANERGGADNITVVVIKCMPSGTVVPIEQPKPAATVAATSATSHVAAKKKIPLPLPLLLGGLGVVAVLIVVLIVLAGNSNAAAPATPKATMVESAPVKAITPSLSPEITATLTVSTPTTGLQYPSLEIVGDSGGKYQSAENVVLQWNPPKDSGLGPNEEYRVWITYTQDTGGLRQGLVLSATSPQITLPREKFFINEQPIARDGSYQWAVAVVAVLSGTVEEISPRTAPLYTFSWTANPPTPVPPKTVQTPTAPTTVPPGVESTLTPGGPTPVTCPSGEYWDTVMNTCRKKPSEPKPPPGTHPTRTPLP